MIEVELPDGTIAEFPDGTPNATIERALRTQSMGPKASFSDVSATSEFTPDKRKPRGGVVNALTDYARKQPGMGTLDALQHHLVNLPVGIAQLAGNTLDAGI